MLVFKYLIAGLANTLVGYCVFIILLSMSNMLPEAANAISYTVALIVAFTLNKVFVFKSSVKNSVAIPKFIAAFAISFLANQLVLILFYRLLNVQPAIAQIPAMISYTVIFYMLNKHYVYRVKPCALEH